MIEEILGFILFLVFSSLLVAPLALKMYMESDHARKQALKSILADDRYTEEQKDTARENYKNW